MKKWTLPLLLSGIGFAGGFLCYATSVDRDVYHAVMRGAANQWLWSYITLLGDGFVQVFACIGMGIFTYFRGQYALSRAWYWAAPLSLVAGLMGQVFKWGIGRPRPKLYPEFYDMQGLSAAASLHSMPSGHTLTSFAIVAMLSPFYPKMRWILLLLAMLAGMSRIFVGAHWLGDVVCGAFLGYALGHVLAQIKKLNKKGSAAA